MKKSTFNFQLSILILFIALTASCNKKEHAHATEYTCPMHPSVIRDIPGACPVCGMDLVRKRETGEEVKITSALNYELKPTNGTVISSIKTVVPVRKNIDITTTANGIITYDTRRISSIPIRFGGRIEKLFIKYNFQPVIEGQKILEIYSPELITAQRDLLYLLKSDRENKMLLDGAKEKLTLLGVSDAQIQELISTGQESHSFNIYSPVSGYVIEERALTAALPAAQGNSQNGRSMEGGMQVGSTKVQTTSGFLTSSELLMREGMYVIGGQVIFKVVNTDYVWYEFDAYHQDDAFIKLNDPLQIKVDNTTVEAKINFVQPFFKNGERFTKARVYLLNHGNEFPVGQLATALFTAKSGNAMWIPLSARLDLGTKVIVFIKRRGVFRPSTIVTARQSGEWIEVKAGLDAKDNIAYNAQFMMDSEGFIKVKN